MKKFSVITLQIVIVLFFVVIPVMLLFLSYSKRITDLSVTESEKNVQNKLTYVTKSFELLADSARSEAVRISSSKDYITAINDLSTYEQIIQDVDLKVSISDVLHRLATVQFTDDKLRNVYLYTLGTDYILTSDRGILRLSALNDLAWLDSYQQTVSGDGQSRTHFWAAWTVPESDLLSNGSRGGETPVMSYISPVRIANSRKISLLVMNYYETKLASLINVDAQNPVYLIDRRGKIVCHPDRELLGRDLSGAAHVRDALNASSVQGYSFSVSRRGLSRVFNPNDEILYSYQRTAVDDWILISENTLLPFTSATVSLTRIYILVLFLFLLAGGLLYFYGIRLIMRPIKQLSHALAGEKGSVRNEILLIEEQIYRMQKQENALLQDVLNSQSDVKKLYLLSLLRGAPYSSAPPIQWEKGGFIVVSFELDGFMQTSVALLPMLLLEGTRAFSPLGPVEGISPDRKSVCFIINLPVDTDGSSRGQIGQIVTSLKREVASKIPITFTSGIGLWEAETEGILRSYRQAVIACRQRMLLGRDQIVFYDEGMGHDQPYAYPKDIETQLVNAIAAANRQALSVALGRLREKMRTQNADSIAQIFNQLTGSIIAYLIESYVVDDILEGGAKQWLAEASQLETLEELLASLDAHAKKIIDYIESAKADDSHIDAILHYIAQHYTEDIDFERMADEIGISYSYMRRIVKAKTNQSLLELVHQKRIEKAKQLLRAQGALSVRDVAVRTGYHNIQSFNRFFKRLEGITPTEYRGIQN